MATYVNDLRLKEIATGDEAGTWGTSTNTNLELIAEAFSFGTEAITTNADTHTTTIADGSTDPGRSLFLKYTGTLDSACTITIGPNTVSKLWLIENATSGSQNIIIKQGSGATVTVPNGQTKAIYSDGAGSGGAMVDAFQDLSIPDLFVDDDLTVGDDLILSSDGAILKFGADADTTLTHTDGSGLTLNSTNKIMFNDASQFIQGSSATVLSLGATDEIDLTATAIDVNGTMDVSGAITSSAGATITVADNSAALTLISTDADADVGPVFILKRNSASAADNDFLGRQQFVGKNDADEEFVLTDILTRITDASDGTEDARFDLNTMVAGTSRNRITVSATETIMNEGSVDLDFRVESDNNANMFLVDAGNDRIQIANLLLGEISSNVDIIQSTSSSGLLVDVTGDITFDADGGDFNFKDGGTTLLSLSNAGSNNVQFLTGISDGDLLFKGVDGGSVITALTLDMSEAGIATFNSGINIGNRGSASDPTLQSAIDPDTGVFWGGSNILGFSSGGAERLRVSSEVVVNEPSNDVDFRVESNADANAFFVNGGDGVVSFGGMGANTRSPSSVEPKFQANSLTRMDSSISLCCNSNDALASLLMFSKTRSANRTGATICQAGDAVGAITWNAADGNDIDHGIAAIDAVVESGIGANDTPGAIRFYTNSGTTAATERWRMTGTGVLVGGGQTPAGLAGDPADANFAEIGPGYLNLARDDTAAAAQILFAKNGTAVSSIQTSTNGLILQVTDGQGSVVANDAGNANTDFRIESSGFANQFYVDAGNNTVGIGRIASSAVVDVESASSGTLTALRIRNRGQVAGSAVKQVFSLNRDASDVDFEAGSISVHKTQNWTATSSTIDSYMVFNIMENEVSREALRLTQDRQVVMPGVADDTTSDAANINIRASDGLVRRSTSSRRYKNTITDATHGLTELLNLRPVTYKGNNDGDRLFGGLIAEEVHEAGLTEFVQYNSDDEPDALAYGHMVSLCIKAIQEQQEQIEELKAEIATLKGE